jgi:nicotinate phosphoribosyltransferase
VLQCQLIETPLLAIVNFQTLVATKAARVCSAAGDDGVLEFGLRRAQGIDGGLTASRAAYIGGCAATSNVLAGKLYDIPVKGTHAHSWVMFFDDELESFRRYADAMPNNCVFLVDTYDTLEGVRHAIEVGHELRARGHRLLGIRLDSGDLAHLATESRRLLDDAGFGDARVFASNDLDEHVITSLKLQGAPIAVWGVGTRLVTAFDQPALGGVYKLGAVEAEDGSWDHRVKLSEQPIKISNPGVLQVRRFYSGDQMVGDMIYDTGTGITARDAVWDILDVSRRRPLPPTTTDVDLLEPIFRAGERVYRSPDIHEVRAHTGRQLQALSPRMKRFLNPHEYPVGLEEALHQRKRELVAAARGQA